MGVRAPGAAAVVEAKPRDPWADPSKRRVGGERRVRAEGRGETAGRWTVVWVWSSVGARRTRSTENPHGRRISASRCCSGVMPTRLRAVGGAGGMF